MLGLFGRSKHAQSQPKEQPLPHGWVAVRDPKTHQLYFVDHHNKKTTWEDPRHLPRHWERRFDKTNGKYFFVDHQHRTTTWKDPRPPISERQITPFNNSNRNNIQSAAAAPVSRSSSLASVVHAEKPKPTRSASVYNVHDHNHQHQAHHDELPLPSYLFEEVKESSNLKQVSTNSTISKEDLKAKEKAANHTIYEGLLKWVIANGTVKLEEEEVLAGFRSKLNIDEEQHLVILEGFGISLDDWDKMRTSVHNESDSGKVSYVDECIICYDSSSTYVILDCMHLCLCKSCALKLHSEGGICPKCRQPIREVRKVSF
jgi:hypothetical protein